MSDRLSCSPVTRALYPYRARVVAQNPYGFEPGHQFELARRVDPVRDGRAGAYPISATHVGEWRVWQFTETEVELELADVGPAAAP